MRISLVIGHLGIGGAERVLCSLAEHLALSGHTVTVFTLNECQPAFYQLSSRVEHVSLDFDGVAMRASRRLRWTGKLTCVWVLRTALRASRPDVVVSFLNTVNIYVLLATLGMRVPAIVSERSNPRNDRLPPFWKMMRSLLYPYAAALVFQTEDARTCFSRSVQLRGKIIPNGVRLPDRFRLGEQTAPSSHLPHRIVAMGRLVEEKGFDLLLRAFSALASEHSEWSLTIWGEGKERNRLESQVNALGLRGRVDLPGETRDSWGRLMEADIFVLSSRTEGFPNVLCEAMACGIPVVSFNCPSGPSELIRDGIDGILVPPEDVSALATSLGRLMNDAELRACLAARAPEVCVRFGHDDVMQAWEKLIVAKGTGELQ